MKKIIFLLLICLLMNGCGSINIYANGIDSAINNECVNKSSNNKGVIAVSNTSENEMVTLSIFSYEDYQDFIANTDLPNDFIQYDDLKMLGEFKSLIFLCPLGEYSSYLYSFIDIACGCKIALYVHGDKNHYSNSLQIERVNSTDMRFLEDEDSGTYVYDGIKYVYVKGKLLSIRWEDESKLFVLTGDNSLSEYSISTSTFVSKMLNTQTVKEAISEFNASITKSPLTVPTSSPEKTDINWVYFVAPPLAIAVLVVCFFVIRKKLKKNR